MPTKFRLGVLTVAAIIFAAATAGAYTIDTSYDGEVGVYLIDEDGLTLYYYDGDDPKKSNVDHDDWDPFYSSEDIDLPSDLDRDDFDTITRDDGRDQTTYKDWPLYLYSNSDPGDVSGDDQYVDGGRMHVAYPTMEQA